MWKRLRELNLRVSITTPGNESVRTSLHCQSHSIELAAKTALPPSRTSQCLARRPREYHTSGSALWIR